MNPIEELLNVFLPSPQFRKWLELATQTTITSYDTIARRFRKGLDYALATGHDGDARLEINLGLTPTPGWGADEEETDEEENEEEKDIPAKKTNGSESKKKIKSEETKSSSPKKKTNGKGKVKVKEEIATEKELEEQVQQDDEEDVGGHEVYMGPGDDETDADAAIYKASTGEEDDNVLFAMPASWNKMSIVVRDSGVLKFVKYVSKSAKGDRWDLGGVFEFKDEEDDEQDTSQETKLSLEDMAESEEEEFNGFPDSDDSGSE
jgi:hypothetical protein